MSEVVCINQTHPGLFLLRVVLLCQRQPPSFFEPQVWVEAPAAFQSPPSERLSGWGAFRTGPRSWMSTGGHSGTCGELFRRDGGGVGLLARLGNVEPLSPDPEVLGGVGQFRGVGGGGEAGGAGPQSEHRLVSPLTAAWHLGSTFFLPSETISTSCLTKHPHVCDSGLRTAPPSLLDVQRQRVQLGGDVCRLCLLVGVGELWVLPPAHQFARFEAVRAVGQLL